MFGPNIKRYFDIGNTELGALVGAQVLAIIMLGVPVGYMGTKIDRDRILRWSAAIWSVFSFATAFAIKLPLMFLTRLGSGVSKASVDPVGKSLLTDYYPPQGWNRILAIHNAANPLGGMLGPLLAGGRRAVRRRRRHVARSRMSSSACRPSSPCSRRGGCASRRTRRSAASPAP